MSVTVSQTQHKHQTFVSSLAKLFSIKKDTIHQKVVHIFGIVPHDGLDKPT